MGILAEGIPSKSVANYEMLRGKECIFSCLPDGEIDIRTPRNFLMRAERKVLSFLAL